MTTLMVVWIFGALACGFLALGVVLWDIGNEWVPRADRAARVVCMFGILAGMFLLLFLMTGLLTFLP